jgi:hypothetical protein
MSCWIQQQVRRNKTDVSCAMKRRVGCVDHRLEIHESKMLTGMTGKKSAAGSKNMEAAEAQ